MSTDSIKVQKLGWMIQLSAEQTAAMELQRLEQRFPRRGHNITIPLTDKDREEYAALADEWATVEKRWEELQNLAQRRNWGRRLGGYEYDDAELFPLTPRTEWVNDETEYEWKARIVAIEAHHAATGEWLEEPCRTLTEMLADEMTRSFNIAVHTEMPTE